MDSLTDLLNPIITRGLMLIAEFIAITAAEILLTIDTYSHIPAIAKVMIALVTIAATLCYQITAIVILESETRK